MKKLLATLNLLIALLLMQITLSAGGILAINQVWSRLADLNGELGSIESSEFSPDSKYIVTGSKFDNMVRLYRTTDGYQVWEYELTQEIERAAWTRDGRYVCSVSEDGYLNVFDVETAEIVFSYEHANGVDGLSASHDGRYMVTGRERIDNIGIARVFSTEDWSIVKELEHPGTVNELDFSPDDQYLAAVGDFTTRVYKVEDWSLHFEYQIDRDRYFEGMRHTFINCKFSPDGKILAVGGQQGYVYFFDSETGELIRRLNKLGQKTETVEWTKDGRYFLQAGHSTTIDFFKVEHILDEEIGNDSVPYALRQTVSDAMEYMDFNSTGTLLTTAHQDGTVQLWTYMSDDPLVNERRHREVRRIQDELARQAGKETN